MARGLHLGLWEPQVHLCSLGHRPARERRPACVPVCRDDKGQRHVAVSRNDSRHDCCGVSERPEAGQQQPGGPCPPGDCLAAAAQRGTRGPGRRSESSGAVGSARPRCVWEERTALSV